MHGNKVVVGVYSFLDDVLATINAAKNNNLDYKVYAPTYIHELDETINHKRSPVSMISLIGALTGITFGFTLAIWCGLDYPLRVSAKNIVAIPSYVVVGYECTILFGALFTLLGVFHFSKLPWIFRQPGYDVRFSNDKFGVVVGCDSKDTAEIEKLLKNHGADETRIDDAL